MSDGYIRIPTRALIGLLVCASAAMAQDDWVAESDAISTHVLETQGRFDPEGISSIGLTQFDDEVTPLGPDLYERSMAASRALLEDIASRRRTTEHPKVLQDLDILAQSIEDAMATAELQRTHLLPWHNVAGDLFGSFRNLLDPRNDPERYSAALVRLDKYTGAAAGYEPFTDMARVTTASRFDVAGLVGPYRGEVERDLDNLPRMLGGIRQAFESTDLEGWEEGLIELEEQLRDYAEWARAEILPRARDENRLPPAIYANNLVNFGVRDEPGDLIRVAEFAFQDIKSQMRTVARRIAEQEGWDDRGLMAVMKRLKTRQIPEDEILDVYRDRLLKIEEIIREENVITLPQRDANIRLATEAESANIPAPFMSPPQLVGNTGQFGEFVLVTKNPSLEGSAAKMDDWNHYGMTWALTVHEARPGHELQFASLVENGTSLARALFAFNSANVEGWGLYSEAIMLEYLPLDGQLFTLLARLQRAARMFLDPLVNLGRITPEEAVTFMIEQVGLSEAMARSEADRYAFLAPGQATSYFYGYMNLMRLRTETELALDERFDERAFHDFVLAQGLLPPELLREAVLTEFVPNQ